MTSFQKISLLILILVIAAFFRLLDLKNTPPGLYPDEAMNGNNALEALTANPAVAGWKVFYQENNGREGLFINIQALFLKALPLREPWVLRLPSALFGILTVLGIYFLAKELFKNTSVALLASFLTAVSFWHINFSRIGFRAIMAPFFLIWGLYFLLKSFRDSSAKGGLNSVFSGIFYGLGFYSYIAYRVSPLLILVACYMLYATCNEKKIFWKNIAVFTITTLIVISPLAIYFLNNPGSFFGRTGQISIFSSPTPLKDLGLNILKTAGQFNFAGDWNSRHNIAGRPLLFWPVGIMFLVGLFVTIKNIIKRRGNYFSHLLTVSWLIIVSLPVVVSNEGIPHALRSIIMIPPVFLLTALGGGKIYDWLSIKINSKMLLQAVCYVFLVALVIESYNSYFLHWAKSKETADAFAKNYVEIGEKLNSLPRDLPKYVVVKAEGVEVRGIPMPAQTVMFITDTFLPEKQKEKNIHYVLANQKNQIPTEAFIVNIE